MICTSETIIKGNDCRNLYVFVLHDIQNLQHLTFCAPQYFRILFAIPFVVRVCWLLLRWLCLQSVFRLFLYPSFVRLSGPDCERERTARNCKADGGWQRRRRWRSRCWWSEWDMLKLRCRLHVKLKCEWKLRMNLYFRFVYISAEWMNCGKRVDEDMLN